MQKIIEGQKWRTRSGAVVTLRSDVDEPITSYPWDLISDQGKNLGSVNVDGHEYHAWTGRGECDLDLVELVSQPFGAGQVWKTRGGELVRIRHIDPDAPSFPVIGIEASTGEEYSYTPAGDYYAPEDTDHRDLVELVSDPSSGWVEWSGGPCPVAEGTLVDVRYRDGEESFGARALRDEEPQRGDRCAEDWSHSNNPGDIVAFRLAEPEAAEEKAEESLPAHMPGSKVRRSLAAMLRAGFSWADTPQGHKYWSDVDKTLVGGDSGFAWCSSLVPEDFPRTRQERAQYIQTILGSVVRGFTRAESPEGQGYWSGVHRELSKLIAHLREARRPRNARPADEAAQLLLQLRGELRDVTPVADDEADFDTEAPKEYYVVFYDDEIVQTHSSLEDAEEAAHACAQDDEDGDRYYVAKVVSSYQAEVVVKRTSEAA